MMLRSQNILFRSIQAPVLYSHREAEQFPHPSITAARGGVNHTKQVGQVIAPCRLTELYNGLNVPFSTTTQTPPFHTNAWKHDARHRAGDGAAIWTTTTSMPKTDAASSPYYIITGPSRQFFSYIQSFNVSNWSAGRPAGAGLPCVFRTESITFCRVGKPVGRGTERYKTRQLNNMADCRSAPFVRNRSRSEISFPGMRLNV